MPVTPPASVQARRFELVGDDGRVLAVLGVLDGRPGRSRAGLALLDENGRARVWIALGAEGPALVFDQGGNDVVHLGVSDPGSDALHVGAHFHLSDLDGRPVVGWRVEADGSLTVSGPPPP